MRTKKANKPPRSIRYLLSVDRRLHRLSLKRISERVKRAKPRLRSSRVKNSAGAMKSMRVPWTMSSPAIALGVIGILAAATLITARQPSDRAEVSSTGTPPEANALVEQEPIAARLDRNAVVSKPPATAAAAKTPRADASMDSTPAVESTKALDSMVKSPAVQPMAKTPTVEPAAKPAGAESTAKADVLNPALVTITGCVEPDQQTFWLKDASGADAPRSRSWRSGFLKKRSAPIELVDPADSLKLSSYVGQRVAATGTLTNREMRAHSLRRVAASCD